MEKTITAKAAVNALGFPDLATDLGARPDADGAENGQEAVSAAALADVLGVLAGSDARDEVRDDADAAVGEAAEQPVLEFTHDADVSLRSWRRV